ncbi:Hypothetical predicted protein [Paramuricea clavata]|uniref:DUF5641 domain-containing protein n=1 Tax=Paramuricea clavata TaxID=317549 RepID=A0A7D9D6U1_PARCT|nr:Hypothetical predicted protein [Paramuricea clavata]
MWTDSFTVLCWIQNDKPWEQYIQRRVDEIRKLVGEDKWMFCPGEFNIADLPSRGCSGAALVKNDEWFHGPNFLKLSEENWPKPPRCNGAESEIALSETVKSVNKSTTHSLTVLEKKHNTVSVGKVVDCHRYSSRIRLLRVTAYVFRFVRRIKGQTVDKTLELSADELIEAEQSVKRCLKKSIGRATLSFEELRTILIEIESTLNNRPITYIYDDEEGISYPLTPSCLLYGRRTTTTPNDSQFEIVSTNESLTRRARHHKTLLKEFTKQWRREYLLSIREAARSSNNGTRDVIVEGDIVILKNESTKRLFWKIAMVEELIRSIDGVVRSAKIRVLNSETRKPIIIRRPIQHLIPLEIRSKFGNEHEEDLVDVNEESSGTQDLSTEPL